MVSVQPQEPNALIQRRAKPLRASVCKRLLGLGCFMCSRSLFPAAPIAGPASVMGEGNHSELFATDVVDDAVGKFP